MCKEIIDSDYKKKGDRGTQYESVGGYEIMCKKKLYLGTNTKMYKTISDTLEYLDRLNLLTADITGDDLELFVIPSFTSLESAGKLLEDSRILLGAQNMGWEESGQFTGEISPIMLKEVRTDIVEIGHSERRHTFGETDQQENLKVKCALKHGFKALFCIGETFEQKNFGLSDEVLSTQLKIGLHGISAEQAENLWLAYEPVWAIGVDGVPATKEYAAAKHRTIRNVLCRLFGDVTGNSIPILYGGSVNNLNAKELMGMPEIDGLFIGRSAWNAENFNKIIRMVYPLWRASN